jgi:hypothetical protein
LNIKFISVSRNALWLKGLEVSLASKLKFESKGLFASFAFYGLAGIILLILLPLSGFPPHIALLGITSLIAAYGLFAKRKWTIWIVAILFFVVTTFTLYTLYFVLATDLIASIAMIAYALLTWLFTAYIALNRKAVEA